MQQQKIPNKGENKGEKTTVLKNITRTYFSKITIQNIVSLGWKSVSAVIQQISLFNSI